MKKRQHAFTKALFLLELAFVLFIPFVIWWGVTPTNVLNSNFLYKLLELVGIFGSGLLSLGMPVGVVGIVMSTKMEKLRKSTLALSIINLFAGIIKSLAILAIFFAVVFGGASV